MPFEIGWSSDKLEYEWYLNATGVGILVGRFRRESALWHPISPQSASRSSDVVGGRVPKDMCLGTFQQREARQTHELMKWSVLNHIS